MTMHSSPRRRGEARTATFVEQAVAEETAQLHCMIPDELHHRLRLLAAQDRTTITALVTEALNDYVASRS